MHLSANHELKAFFLAGPTATGKTDVSQHLAEKHSCDILSADAMMVYRGMNIGTAKPSPEFRDRVRYWGLDLAAPADTFSVGQYRLHALDAIRECSSAGRNMIVVGGTGLYIKSLTHGLGRLPASDPSVRNMAEELLQDKGLGALQEWVRKQAPEQYESIVDKNNPRRLVRLIETLHGSVGGENKSWCFMGKGPKIAGLTMPRPVLNERIRLRVQEMYSEGLLDEAETLLREGVEKSPTAAKAVGYTEAFSVLRKKITVEEAIELTSKRTRQFAKRQMTWFRNQADVDWIMVDPGMTTEQTAQKVLGCWERNGPASLAP